MVVCDVKTSEMANPFKHKPAIDIQATYAGRCLRQMTTMMVLPRKGSRDTVAATERHQPLVFTRSVGLGGPRDR